MGLSKYLKLCLCGVFAGAAAGRAAEPVQFQAIGAVTAVTRTESAVVLTCADNSAVQITVLAPDLVRVRTAFRQPLAARDHSWAIARTSWDVPPWTLREGAEALQLATGELEVIIHRTPLLIEFRDAGTHRLINADQRPMAFDPKGESIVAAKRLGLDEHFYGLGEKAARLDKRRGVFTLWNSDTPGFVEGTDPLYQSIPFYLGWAGGAAYGLFFDNSYRTHFDFGSTNQEYVEFSAEGGEMNYYFFRGPSMKKILGRYADLTGHMPLPPLWALGHQQSRYSYYPDTLAEEIVRQYRAHDLPLDVLHLDIHYMSGYRNFTWDPQRFPDPKGFVGRLKEQGVKVVTIVDPGVKVQASAPGATDLREHPELAPQDKSYYVYNEGRAQDFFLKRQNGEPYLGRAWPGESVFVDYTLEAAARWWGDLHRAYTDQGVAGIWTDMNEPADLADKSGQSQKDVIFDDLGTHSSYGKNRNVFALGMVRATYEGLERLRPNERPFVITRAGFAGIQRYSTMWTGDNNCTWESLALSLPMLETLGLSGEPFVGADIPGFRGTADGELLARWYQVGFLAPLCRNHSENRSYDHEPWRFGTYYEDIVRKYLKLRYRLLPYLYTVLEEAHRTGVPLFRPLLLNYQDDQNTLTIDDEFMVGTELLAAPVLKAGQTRRLVYLPQGLWYDYWTGVRHPGGTTISMDAPLDTLPLFVRGGSILPLGPEMNYVGERPSTPLRFELYPDEDGHASTTLYEDDGTTIAYRNGNNRHTTINCMPSAGGFQITLSAPQGKYRPAGRQFEFALHSSVAVREVSVDGRALPAGSTDSIRGWYQREGQVIVRIRDDSQAHAVQLNTN